MVWKYVAVNAQSLLAAFLAEDTGDDWAAAMAEQAIEEAQQVELDELVDDSKPISKEDAAKLDSILDIYKPEAEKLIAASTVSYTKEQKEIYKTIGGTPFLDMDYTVYGEVVKGLDVLDKIAAVKVGGSQNSLPMSKIVMDVDIELLKKKEITRKTGYEYKK